MTDEDFALALQLQSQLFQDEEYEDQDDCKLLRDQNKPMSLVDPFWELTDPNPDMRALFLEFNEKYFWGRLAGVEVKWSSRMTLCAGLCRYEGRGGLCSISLSVPLLKLRPRKDLVETLLHEMIHAYLFVTDNNRDHDGHGPEFHKHMYRLNKETGTNITVYHNFHDEVDLYKQHWWRCNGPCQNRKPYFGYVKRSMNRAPSKNDIWWAEHQRTCGGTYTKIKEPEGYGKKKTKGEKEEKSKGEKGKGVKSMDIRIFGGEGKILGKPKNSGQSNSGTKNGNSMPTATITSGVLSRQNNDSKAGKDDNDTKSDSGLVTNTKKDNDSGRVVNRKDTDGLPGASTPTKAVKNKPVSQGGNIPFNKVKKKVLHVLDFSDSDDDDDLLEAVSRIDTGVSCDSKTQKGSTASSGKNSGASDDINTVQKFSSDKGRDNAEDNIDKNDVRAMLRKVWGQKQIGQNKLLTKQVLTDKDKTEAQKRGLPNTDSNPVSKRIKLTNTENEVITHGAGSSSSVMSKVVNDNDGTSESHVPSKCPNHGSSQYRAESDIPKVTSPIEKLFNKMKDKHKNQSVESTDANSAVIASDCATKNTVINSNNTHTDTETSVCPVCCQSVPLSSINDHLDLCLTLKAIG